VFATRKEKDMGKNWIWSIFNRAYFHTSRERVRNGAVEDGWRIKSKTKNVFHIEKV
jgi:hypothetical protein